MSRLFVGVSSGISITMCVFRSVGMYSCPTYTVDSGMAVSWALMSSSVHVHPCEVSGISSPLWSGFAGSSVISSTSLCEYSWSTVPS